MVIREWEMILSSTGINSESKGTVFKSTDLQFAEETELIRASVEKA